MATDWKDGFVDRFSGKRHEECPPIEEVEDAAADIMDRLAVEIRELPESIVGVRVKPPCEPCARMASMMVH